MENKPKKKRWKKNNIDYEENWGNRKHYNKYGFIEIENPTYYTDKNCSSDDEFFIRKPTPQERKEIVINYIRQHHSEFIDLWYLAYKLAVSQRTIKKLVADLKKEATAQTDSSLTPWHIQVRLADRYPDAPANNSACG